MRTMLKRMVDSPKVLAGMVAVLVLPWVLLEATLTRSEMVTAIRLGFIIGLASYPLHYLIFRLSFAQGIEKALWGITLSFLNKIVIVLVSGFLLWGFWRINLLYYMPPLFFTLLSLSFFALYFAKQ